MRFESHLFIIDREEISELDRTINEACNTADVQAKYYAAVVYMLLDNNDKAYSLIEKSNDSNNIQVVFLIFHPLLNLFID